MLDYNQFYFVELFVLYIANYKSRNNEKIVLPKYKDNVA